MIQFFQWFQISVLSKQILITDNPLICLTMLFTEVRMILNLYFFQITGVYPNSPMWPSPPWPQLASYCGPHPIQDDGAGLQGCQRNCTRLPPNTGQTTCPSERTWLIYISWPPDTVIAESKQSPLRERLRDSSLFWHLSGGTNSWPMSGQWNHSPSSAKDFFYFSFFSKHTPTQ